MNTSYKKWANYFKLEDILLRNINKVWKQNEQFFTKYNP